MKDISLEQEAEFKAGIRELYRKKGFETCAQVLYEIIRSAQMVAEVMQEEGHNGK